MASRGSAEALFRDLLAGGSLTKAHRKVLSALAVGDPAARSALAKSGQDTSCESVAEENGLRRALRRLAAAPPGLPPPDEPPPEPLRYLEPPLRQALLAAMRGEGDLALARLAIEEMLTLVRYAGPGRPVEPPPFDLLGCLDETRAAILEGLSLASGERRDLRVLVAAARCRLALGWDDREAETAREQALAGLCPDSCSEVAAAVHESDGWWLESRGKRTAAMFAISAAFRAKPFGLPPDLQAYLGQIRAAMVFEGGALEWGRSAMEQALGDLPDWDRSRLRNLLLVRLAHIEVTLGWFETAKRRLIAAAEDFEAGAPPVEQGQRLYLLGTALRQSGDPTAAVDYLMRARDAYRESGWGSLMADSLREEAIACLESGDQKTLVERVACFAGMMRHERCREQSRKALTQLIAIGEEHGVFIHGVDWALELPVVETSVY